MKRLTQEEFLKKAIKKFPQYDFSKAVYINGKTQVKVTCPKHGDFLIRGDCLLNGTGCPYCGGTKKMDTKKFIEKASFVHNNFFTYEHCNYKTSNEKVIVTCPFHGDFEVKANNHLNGCNCKKCQQEKKFHKITKLPKVNASTKKITTEEFIERAKAIWGNKYSYEKTIYKHSNEHVLITCPKHGVFTVTPNHFLNNRGCPKCGKNKKMTTNEFIEEARKIHGDKYDYTHTNYKTTHTNVIITCPTHGNFLQTPSNHLKGQGCPCCKQSHLEEEVATILLENNIKYEQQKKFKWLGKQSLDFFLPDYNIGIECQGIQHFEPIKYYGGEKSFLRQTKYDERKKSLCQTNGITIVYYANYEYNFPYEVEITKEKLIEKIKKYD